MKQVLSIFFKLITFLVSVFGLILTFQDFHNVLEISSYFTTIVNFLSTIVMIYMIVFYLLKLEVKGFLYFWYQCTLVMLVVTMFVYGILLVPFLIQQNTGYDVFSLRDTVIHFLVPVLFAADYLMFSKKGTARRWMIGSNILIPFLYLIYLQVYDQLGGRFTFGETVNRFPYFFLNVERVGWPMFIMYMMGMIGFVWFVSWIFYIVDEIISTQISERYKISKSK